MGIESRSAEMMSIYGQAKSDWHTLMEVEYESQYGKPTPRMKTLEEIIAEDEKMRGEIEKAICAVRLPVYVKAFNEINQAIQEYTEHRDAIKRNSNDIESVGGDTYETRQEISILTDIIKKDQSAYKMYKPTVDVLLGKCDEFQLIPDCKNSKLICNPSDEFGIWMDAMDIPNICKC